MIQGIPSLLYVFVIWTLGFLLKHHTLSVTAPVSTPGLSAPVGHGIRVHVRRRRSRHWDFWQLNSNICPPSLCFQSDGSGNSPRRPRGTGTSVFYNGDIVLDSDAAKYIFQNEGSRRKRATVRFRNRLWKDGILYYKFDSQLSPRAKQAVRKAMVHISNRTCIQFKKKTKGIDDYVRIISEPGCWSNVGHVGGEQKLSLGSGCEQEGTAIHELAHALGFWHEHSRPDRNKYVEILYDNVSPTYTKDFEQINNSLANSRGFPYDYRSIMHYKERTFTVNGGKTIKVIGVGKKLYLTIGQREGLSDLDIAQLRDMYRCNLLKDKNETVCQDGWEKFQRSCYKFIVRPRAQFSAARKKCTELNAGLVSIDNKNEDSFLKKHVNKNFPKVSKWRTAGRKIKGNLMWDLTQHTKNYEPLSYENWGDQSLRSFSSLVLFRNKTAKVVEWRGDWAGSAKQLPKYAYSYICERPAKRKCLPLMHPDGRDYRGTLDHTREGITCQRWTSRYPHNHTLIPRKAVEENSEGLGPHNFCRNPAGQRRNRPWCFTTKEKKEWEYCDVSTCQTPKKPKTTPSPTTERPRTVYTWEDDGTGDVVSREEGPIVQTGESGVDFDFTDSTLQRKREKPANPPSRDQNKNKKREGGYRSLETGKRRRGNKRRKGKGRRRHGRRGKGGRKGSRKG